MTRYLDLGPENDHSDKKVKMKTRVRNDLAGRLSDVSTTLAWHWH